MKIFRKANAKVEQIIREEITVPERREKAREAADSWGCSDCPNIAFCVVNGCQK